MNQSSHVISYITLGVNDLNCMKDFYSGLGLTLHAQRQDKDYPYVMYKSGGLILALIPKDLLAKQSGCAIKNSETNKAMSLSINVTSKGKVDEYLVLAKRLNAQITREGFEPAWGGYCAYFKDPEGNLWEVVWNPKFNFES